MCILWRITHSKFWDETDNKTYAEKVMCLKKVIAMEQLQRIIQKGIITQLQRGSYQLQRGSYE